MDRILIILLASAFLCTSTWSQQPPPGEPGEGPEFKGQHNRQRFNPKEEKGARERLRRLIQLPNDEVMAELQKWPKFQKMNLDEQGKFLSRIQEMKERQRAMAQQKAEELGLNLTGKTMDQFERRCAEKQFEMGRKLKEQMEPIRRQMELQMNQDLKNEFGAGSLSTPKAP